MAKQTPIQHTVAKIRKLIERYDYECEDEHYWRSDFYDKARFNRNREFKGEMKKFALELIAIFEKPAYKHLRYHHIFSILSRLDATRRHTNPSRKCEVVVEGLLDDDELKNLDELRVLDDYRTTDMNVDWRKLSWELSRCARLAAKEYGSGPEQCREEVTGLSTKGTNKNTGNSGFSGGTIGRLAAA